MQRLIPSELLKHHWNSLADRSRGKGALKRDWPVTIVLVIVPCAAGVSAYRSDLQLTAPASLLAALSLMSAGLLAAFGQIASIRSKYRLPDDDYDPEWRTREMLDEAVAHILTAALVAVLTAVIIVVGMNAGAGNGRQLAVLASAGVVGFGSYLVLVFLMVVRKLWGAYEAANERDQAGNYLHR